MPFFSAFIIKTVKIQSRKCLENKDHVDVWILLYNLNAISTYDFFCV